MRDGFLADPRGFQFGEEVSDLVSSAELFDLWCLVLLGEPGSGKSTWLRDEADRHREQDSNVEWVDLRDYSSEVRLEARFTEIAEAAALADVTYLYVDSIDEALVRIGPVTSLLAEVLRRIPLDKLRVRIACRTLDWPEWFVADLAEVWGQDNVHILEIAPLREVDVRIAAEAEHLDPDDVLKQIKTRGLQSLATRPVTLNLLLAQFDQAHADKESVVEIYERGCRLLADEPDARRRVQGSSRRGARRLALARRLAFFLVFSNSAAIWVEIDQGTVSPGDLRIADVAGGSELADGEVEATEEALLDALDSGLFSSRGIHRTGFSHQTYAEYLAASYAARRIQSTGQLENLLFQKHAGRNAVIPQLRDVAAWLSLLRGDFLDLVLDAEPELLLRIDTRELSPRYREKIVQRLLSQTETRFARRYIPPTVLERLNHPTLAGQVRLCLLNAALPVEVRRIAIDLAEACRLSSLSEDLAALALTTNEPIGLRVGSLYALAAIGAGSAKRTLRPLIEDEIEDDNYELRGAALKALWPDHISLREVVPYLAPLENTSFFGAYYSFVADDLARYCPEDELPEALEWLAARDRGGDEDSAFQAAEEKFIIRAWPHMDRHEVCRGLARLVLERVRNHTPIMRAGLQDDFLRQFSADSQSRRQLFQCCLSEMDSESDDVLWLTWDAPMLLDSDDVPWVVELFPEYDESKQRVMATFLFRIADLEKGDHFKLLYERSREIPVLQEALAPWVEPVLTVGESADRLRKHHSLLHPHRGNPDDPVLRAVENLRRLITDQAGNQSLWSELVEVVVMRSQPGLLNADLTSSPVWNTLGEDERESLTDTALTFIKHCPCREWVPTGTSIPLPCVAGVYAFEVILNQNRQDSLATDDWKNWLPSIVAFPISTGNGGRAYDEVLTRCYQAHPQAVLDQISALVDVDAKRTGYAFALSKLRVIWDARSKELVLDKLRNRGTPPRVLEQTLDLLFIEAPTEAISEARNVARRESADADSSRSVQAIAFLLSRDPVSSWHDIWTAFEKSKRLGKDVLEHVAQRRYTDKFHMLLDEDMLASLFVWISENFRDVVIPTGAHMVSPEENVLRLRDEILIALKGRGTWEAVEAIRRIGQQLPELAWLQWTLWEAEELAREKTWVPPPLEDLVAMMSAPDKDLVTTGTHLLNRLEETLRKFADELHGNPPAARDLWDLQADGSLRPVDERTFGDRLARHLKRDLISAGAVVNREVEVRRAPDAGFGESADLHVSVRSNNEFDEEIIAIIEVKSCWSRDLITGLEGQLVGRYLKSVGTRFGFYVIAGYKSERWDESDRRRQACSKVRQRKTMTTLQEKASQASGMGLDVRVAWIDCSYA
jgi:hypothetical protein